MAEPKTAVHPPHSTVDVREMEIDDLARVYHLGEDLFTSDRYPFLYRTWDQWEVIGLYNTDAEYCLVAEIDEELAGFVLGTVISKASWTYGYVIWLGVNPAFQRRGVADKLVDKLVERMIEEGARYMLVDTDPRNKGAVKFFHSKGFGNTREHVFLSMNLSKHDRYGRLIAREREREKAEKAVRKRKASSRTRQPEIPVSDPMVRPLGPDAELGETSRHERPPMDLEPMSSGVAGLPDSARETRSGGDTLTAFGPPADAGQPAQPAEQSPPHEGGL